MTCTRTQITLTASGANTFSWSTGEKVATKVVTNAGKYSVTGRAANGCETTQEDHRSPLHRDRQGGRWLAD